MNQRLHEVTLVIEKLGELSVLLPGSVLPIGGVFELGWAVLVAALGLILVVRPAGCAHQPAAERPALASAAVHRLVRHSWHRVHLLPWLRLRRAHAGPRQLLFGVVAVAILASVVLHGVSSAVLTRRLMATDRRAAATSRR